VLNGAAAVEVTRANSSEINWSDDILGMVARLLPSSLANAVGARSVGVILSGALTDGTAGLRDIHLAGGVTFAQDEATAQTPSMPHNAIAAGHVDQALAPRAIGTQLAHLGQERQDEGSVPVTAENADPAVLDEIFTLVHQETGVDFATYKRSTLARRIDRRRRPGSRP
jgi:two-component system CheB/CheR fusion protein